MSIANPVLLDVDQLPKPRMQLRWIQTGPTWSERECVYELIVPLRPNDIRREREDGHEADYVAIEFGCTTCDDDAVLSPLEEADPEHGMSGPYRDTSHALWDAEALGNLPVYVVCDGKATRMAQPDKRERRPTKAV